MDLSTLSIVQIKEKLSSSTEIDNQLLVAIAMDERSGVQKLYQQILNQKEKELKEIHRTQVMYKYEEELWNQGFIVAGIDEAGRGPLAGPVVAGAVILPQGKKLYGINDSKKLSEKKRDELAEIIKEDAIAWSLGIVDAETIDEINILQATKLAMQKAVEGLSHSPNYLLIDAVTIPNLAIKQKGIIGGDQVSVSVAAASILAKTTRDSLMLKYHEQYPQYGFGQHKGYGTAEHIEALQTYGASPIHRKTFNLVTQNMFNLE
jgi:ribonuclease HII